MDPHPYFDFFIGKKPNKKVKIGMGAIPYRLLRLEFK